MLACVLRGAVGSTRRAERRADSRADSKADSRAVFRLAHPERPGVAVPRRVRLRRRAPLEYRTSRRSGRGRTRGLRRIRRRLCRGRCGARGRPRVRRCGCDRPPTSAVEAGWRQGGCRVEAGWSKGGVRWESVGSQGRARAVVSCEGSGVAQSDRPRRSSSVCSTVAQYSAAVQYSAVLCSTNPHTKKNHLVRRANLVRPGRSVRGEAICRRSHMQLVHLGKGQGRRWDGVLYTMLYL